MGLEIDRAEGCHIHTTDGRSFVDLISGIAVSSLGHRHPNVIKAIQKQLDSHLHVMVYGEFIQKPQSEFAQLLCDQLPGQLDRVYFVNSGTEANEGALKLAKNQQADQSLWRSEIATTAIRTAHSALQAGMSTAIPTCRYCPM